MATASVSNTLVDATTIEVNPLNTNFSDLVTFLNGSVVHADGTNALTGNLSAGFNKITDLAAPTLDNDAARKIDVDNVTIGGHTHVATDVLDTAGAFVTTLIPDLAASKVTSGTFASARIPDLAASKITSGTFAIARIPTGTTSSTVALGNHNHSGVYLGVSSKAADSNLLDGIDSTAFLRSNVSDTFTGDILTFNDSTSTEVIRISATQGKNHIIWSNNPYTNGVGDYQAYWDNDMDGSNVGWAISTTLSSGGAIKKDIVDYDVEGVGEAFLRIPMRSWKYDAAAMAALGMPIAPKADTHHFYVAEEVAAELPWLVGKPKQDPVPRIKDGRPLQVAMIATIHHLNAKIEALEARVAALEG